MVNQVLTKGLEQLDEVLSIVEEAMEFVDFPCKTISQVMLATEEVYCNIVKYAQMNGRNDIQFSYEISDNPLSITIRFLDSGIMFNPLEKNEPDVTAPLEDRPIGGLGIYLVKRSMDEVNYRYQNGNNILVLKKYA